MRSTWISGFYRFSTRKAGSLDIFRFRNFAVGGLRDWSIPGIEPSPCDSEAIRQLAQAQLESLVWQKAALYYSFRHPLPATSIRVSLKSRHRSNSKGGIQKEGLHATTVNPSLSCSRGEPVQTLKPAIPNGIPAVPVSGFNAKIPMTENCVSFAFPLYRDGKTARVLVPRYIGTGKLRDFCFPAISGWENCATFTFPLYRDGKTARLLLSRYIGMGKQKSRSF